MADLGDENQKHIDREVRELISALTSRLTAIQRGPKNGSSMDQHNQEANDHGVRMITLAGSNLGATMRGEIDQKPESLQGQVELPESDDFTTYVNSNFQAINNSIMIGGNYETNDPGVHLDISDYKEDHITRRPRGKKSNRNESGGSKSDHNTQHSE
ncbi:hypothetical protein F511_04089 [Dorcoceras hygrometricum]|uniref:Uncharacterized protein n=1 Tax=Dorcoceras hygrometricum TaxID=472368 RepID=A0A2Z7CE66_9LAMI|nr:hypothetical protein F511_04089 [Dorcoceras hygrometricum]